MTQKRKGSRGVMVMQNNRLTVEYKISERINRRLDKAIVKAIEKLGWTFFGSGFAYKTEVRDLVFKKDEK